jgi:hypothetical protein
MTKAAATIVRHLLEDETDDPDHFKDVYTDIYTDGMPVTPELLARFKRQVAAYIKWVDAPDGDAGYMPDHRADFRRLRRATTFEQVQEILAKYDTTPSFLSMIQQGYFA